MVFNSFEYLAFLPATALVYFALPARFRWVFLLLASLCFYGFDNLRALLHSLAVGALAWQLGIRIEDAPDKGKKVRLLTWGVVLLVANLFVFKYTGFVNESLRTLCQALGVPYPVPPVRLELPLGISFYTFLLIGYLVDVHRGEKAERHPGIFALFLTFFPKVVSGPIERAKRLLPQLGQQHSFDYARAVASVELIAWGLFKKLVVADRLAPFVARVYTDPRAHDGVGMAAATWLFAFQVYCDFSGYTDIARGSAKLLGIDLMENFNRPYFATSVGDFWKRWHISLTSWLTDYVYTPLTRQRRVKVKLYYLIFAASFITFLVSGLWHGAQWTYVVWGGLHGIYIVCGMLTQRWRAKVASAWKLERVPRLHRAYKIAVTFTLVSLAYVFFQAKSLSDAGYILTHLFTGWGHAPASLRVVLNGQWSDLSFGLLGAATVLLVEARGSGTIHEMLARRPVWVRWAIYQTCAITIVLFGAFYDTQQTFIYFQF